MAASEVVMGLSHAVNPRGFPRAATWMVSWAYRRMSQKAGKVWREHSALEYVECVADDVKRGKWTSYPQSVKLKRGEVVLFSFIVYKSRADRDRVNTEVRKDKPLVVDA